MMSRFAESFSLTQLQEIDRAKNSWFSEQSPTGLAGRCLLDTLEYLRTFPNFPGRFRPIAQAHSIRLACTCLSDGDLDRRVVLERMKPRIQEVCSQLLQSRNNRPPL